MNTEVAEVRRTVNASPERVWAAWNDPEQARQWSAPDVLTVSLFEGDLRVGGRYRLHMQEPNGKEHRASGVFREIDPPHRMVYTWSWETDREPLESLVTVEFQDRDGGTEVVLRHSGLRNPEERQGHEEGWASSLEKLAGLLSSRAESPKP